MALKEMAAGFLTQKIMIYIVTVCLNDADALETTIRSVDDQDFLPAGHFIFDGGSSDHTDQVVLKYPKAFRHFYSQKDNGIYDAMNKALQYIPGGFVLFLNAGETFTDQRALWDVVNAIATLDPKQTLIHSFASVSDGGNFTPAISMRSQLATDSYGRHEAVAFPVTTHQDFKYNTKYRIKADRDLMLRMSRVTRFVGHQRPIIRYSTTGISAVDIPRKEIENILVTIDNEGWNANAWHSLASGVSKTILYYSAKTIGINWAQVKKFKFISKYLTTEPTLKK